MDMSKVKTIQLNGKDVVQIADKDGKILWKKQHKI